MDYIMIWKEKMFEPPHVPALAGEVVHLVDPKPGGIYVDGTIGLGGHTQALFALEPNITVVGIDLDREALSYAEKGLASLAGRLHLVHANYTDLHKHLRILGIEKVDGLILDLGVSSLQLDNPKRGFSFRANGPLDMRMDTSQPLTAFDIVNNLTEKELVDILFRYGEEKFAREIVRAIVATRKLGAIGTTTQLAELVYQTIPKQFHLGHRHPATRTFQALRIAVNDELRNLRNGLQTAFQCLAPDGVIAVISFHSLEDRIVKRFFRYKVLDCICPPTLPECVCDKQVEGRILTRKPILPTEEETKNNPRARAAKLRAMRKSRVST